MSIQLLTSITFIIALVLTQVQALSVFPGSPCFDTCNGGSATGQNDIVCTDSDFANTDAGKTLSKCLTCLHGSGFQNGFVTDSSTFNCKPTHINDSLVLTRTRLSFNHPANLSRKQRRNVFVLLHMLRPCQLILGSQPSQPTSKSFLLLFRQWQHIFRFSLQMRNVPAIE